MKIRGFSDNQLDLVVWRYMPFAKYISLVTYRALWFSRLDILQDKYEGIIPLATKQRVREENESFKRQFDTPEFHRQIDAWPEDNEKSGRKLQVVSCWFLDEEESSRMWEEYGTSPEAIAVRTTIRRLAHAVRVIKDPKYSQLGAVSYIDHDQYEMSSYEAAQAIERAFLKDATQFQHEKEVRIVTMNFKTPDCISPAGVPYSLDDVKNERMNNLECSGLYIGADLDLLIQEIVTSPRAETWFSSLVARVAKLCGLSCPVTASTLRPDA